ncbi:MAG: IclR family transcriptional regulator [Gammaproteobacteria bacterium]|nr:IclR family transcriptional regulator [Gammaproteobacteria bacterium]
MATALTPAGLAAPATVDAKVKSAARVFAILELFRIETRPLKTTEVALALDYPKSSTSAILKSLVTLGYLSYDRRVRRYFPTLRVTMLGEWLPQHLSDVHDFGPLLDALQAATQETVTLSMRDGLTMQVLRLRQSMHAIAVNAAEGFRIPMFNSAVGQAFLATQPDDLVRDVVAQYNAMRSGDVEPVQDEVVLAGLRPIREQGYAVAYDQALPDTGAVAMALPTAAHKLPLVIAVAGLAHRMQARESTVINAMRRLVSTVEPAP